jgi:hypothetical protein
MSEDFDPVKAVLQIEVGPVLEAIRALEDATRVTQATLDITITV